MYTPIPVPSSGIYYLVTHSSSSLPLFLILHTADRCTIHNCTVVEPEIKPKIRNINWDRVKKRRNCEELEKKGRKKFLSPFEPEIPFNETNETPLDRCSYYPVNERNCLGSGLWRIPRNSRWKTVKGLKRRKKLGGKWYYNMHTFYEGQSRTSRSRPNAFDKIAFRVSRVDFSWRAIDRNYLIISVSVPADSTRFNTRSMVIYINDDDNIGLTASLKVSLKLLLASLNCCI